MTREIELLAPGGDIDSIKAAILAGADAVYCGLEKYNARNRANNIVFGDLYGVLRLAHQYNCEVFLTLNIVILDAEIPNLIGLLNKLVNAGLDGVIVQDLGLLYLLSEHFKSLSIHVSTQMTTHNTGQIQFLNQFNINRVNLSRELNISEIANLTQFAHEQSVLTEVFVHGSYCISFSGICYMSSVLSGKSGNRGRCSQPCRERYETTEQGMDYPLNLKDNSAFYDLRILSDAGVDSIKIEGRIKEYEYVYTVVDTWRKQLQNFYKHNTTLADNSALHKVFNREFTNGFLKGEIDKHMFIDQPMSNSTKHLSDINQFENEQQKQDAKLELYQEKDINREWIKTQIDALDLSPMLLNIRVIAVLNQKLKLEVKTSDSTIEILSKYPLSDQGFQVLNRSILLKKMAPFKQPGFVVEDFDTTEVGENLYIPLSELSNMKRKLRFILNDEREAIPPVELPKLKNRPTENSEAQLIILISSVKDAELRHSNQSKVYFQLPSNMSKQLEFYLELFTKHSQLLPWFPSILIGKDFDAAVQFLIQIRPKCIVTNNTGIANETYANHIDWIAGPQMNLTNSYALKALKETFNCTGAFISNELKKGQIKYIVKPDNFELNYSIYHPMVLMTTRQCLFHQVSGCEKHILDQTCIDSCEKQTTITNLKQERFLIEKSKGDYHNVYHSSHFLNLDIMDDFKNQFSNYLIDLRDIPNETQDQIEKLKIDKPNLIRLFESCILGTEDVKTKLEELLNPYYNTQYQKGI